MEGVRNEKETKEEAVKTAKQSKCYVKMLQKTTMSKSRQQSVQIRYCPPQSNIVKWRDGGAEHRGRPGGHHPRVRQRIRTQRKIEHEAREPILPRKRLFPQKMKNLLGGVLPPNQVGPGPLPHLHLLFNTCPTSTNTPVSSAIIRLT